MKESPRLAWDEIFEPVAGGMLKNGPSHFTPPANGKMKGRKFKGASTKRGYGPVSAPAVANSVGGMTIASYGKEAQPNGEAPASAPTAMGESVSFIKFLDKLVTPENKELIESVKMGYTAIVDQA